jgi:CheY-like chemotaxis protein
MKDSITVLLVDDSRIQRSITKNLTIQLGQEYHFQVVALEAEDGKEAIAMLGETEVDLILLDWHLPSISGLEFVQAIHALEKCRDLVIVMVTAEAAHDCIVAALKEGVRDYLIKPLEPVTFRKKMISLIQEIA